MPELLLYRGDVPLRCLYDQEDHERISLHSWRANDKDYAYTCINGKTILMHRFVLNVTDPKILVDHRFHNRLDNRKSQLRICNHSENRRNSIKHDQSATSRYKGVYWESGVSRFHSQIGVGERVFNLGRYSSEIHAAKAYDRRALELFQDFANINFKSSAEARQLAFPWIQ